MGDHDDNHNHGHKKRGEILHLEKIITKKKRTNKYHKDQDKYWKARTRIRTKMTRTGTSRKMTRGRTRRKITRARTSRKMERTRRKMERWKGPGT